MSQQSRQTRLHVTVSDSVREYLQLKAELTGKPEATLMGELAFDAMKQEFATLLELKAKLLEAATFHDDAPPPD